MNTMKKCPYCAEEILEEALKCKHCGSMLNERAAIQAPPLPPPPDGTLETFWYIIIWVAALVPLGSWVVVILSSVMYYAWKDTNPLKAKAINSQGWLAFIAGHVLWGLIWCGLKSV